MTGKARKRVTCLRVGWPLLLLLGLLLPNRARTQVQWEVVESNLLNTDIRYTSFSTGTAPTATIYFTDGAKLLAEGYDEELQRLTELDSLPAARYVFVSTLDSTGTDRRNDYFFCIPDYLRFFTEELLPAVEGTNPLDPANRYLVGVSFGGLNAAYFASQGAPFAGYGLLSPITYPRRRELAKHIAFGPRTGQRFFISTGRYDAEVYVEELLAFYGRREFAVRAHYVAGGHEFGTWLGQLGVGLRYLLLN